MSLNVRGMTVHPIEDFEIAAGAQRDADTVGQEVDAVQLGGRELTFHAETVLQRPVQALIGRVEQVLIR